MTLRKKYWLIALAWLMFIYATLGIVRPLCEFLRSTGYLGLSVNIMIIGFLIVCKFYIFRKKRVSRLSATLIILIFLIYLAAIWKIPIPEERIHFIQYGFLSFLIFRAIDVDLKSWRAYALALVLTAIFGWIDEGIQFLLPNRFYDTRDVLINVFSGVMGLLLTFALRREKLIE